MRLEETISIYEMRVSLEETIGDISNAEEHKQVAEWLRELKAYKKVRRILSQNRIATDRYGDVVMWDDIKRVFKEINADV